MKLSVDNFTYAMDEGHISSATVSFVGNIAGSFIAATIIVADEDLMNASPTEVVDRARLKLVELVAVEVETAEEPLAEPIEGKVE